MERQTRREPRVAGRQDLFVPEPRLVVGSPGSRGIRDIAEGTAAGVARRTRRLAAGVGEVPARARSLIEEVTGGAGHLPDRLRTLVRGHPGRALVASLVVGALVGAALRRTALRRPEEVCRGRA